MLAGIHVFIAERDGEFNRQVQWLQADGNPHDLTGKDIHMDIVENIGGLNIVTWTLGVEIAADEASGLIQIVVSGADMSALTFTRAHYYLYVDDVLILKGPFVVENF